MHRIAVFPGDGIGPEVVREGLKVLRTVSEVAGFKYELEEFPYSSEHYLATDILLPPDVLQRLRDFSAIYLGAIGDPRLPVGLIERGIILGMRFGLDLYINLRPVKLYSERFCLHPGQGHRRPERAAHLTAGARGSGRCAPATRPGRRRPAARVRRRSPRPRPRRAGRCRA